LDRRSEAEKKTAAGKIETATLKQTRIYLKPFFQLLAKQRVPPEIMKEAKTIYDGVVTRNYLLSNDAYYRLAIGNSPWPVRRLPLSDNLLLECVADMFDHLDRWE
jgi:hypothetical protein